MGSMRIFKRLLVYFGFVPQPVVVLPLDRFSIEETICEMLQRFEMKEGHLIKVTIEPSISYCEKVRR